MSRITTRFSTRNVLISSLFALAFLVGNTRAMAQHEANHDHSTGAETIKTEIEHLDTTLIEGAEHVGSKDGQAGLERKQVSRRLTAKWRSTM